MMTVRELLNDLVKFSTANGDDAYDHLLWLWNEMIPAENVQTIIAELYDNKLAERVQEKFERTFGIDPFFGMV